MSDINANTGTGSRDDPMEIDSGLQTPAPKSTIEPTTPTPQKRTPGTGASSAKKGKERAAPVMVDMGTQMTTPPPPPATTSRGTVIDDIALQSAVVKVLNEESSDDEVPADKDKPYANRKVLQKTLKAQETFRPHPTKPKKIIATFRIQKPHGSGEYVQIDSIPELVKGSTPNGKATYYFVPALEKAKGPRKIRARKGQAPILWVPEPHNERWVRHYVVKGVQKMETFRPTILLRRFNTVTHEYEHAYLGEKKLQNVDPNDKKWMYAYNKWIDQIRRRRDSGYIKRVFRDHWEPPEMRAFYTTINVICHRKGINCFGVGRDTGMVTADYQEIADAVKAAGGKNRNVDAIRGKIISAHPTKDKPMADLRMLADEVRNYLEEGGVLGDDELYPEHAIPVADFPADVTPKAEKGKKAPAGAKEDEEDLDEEPEDAGENLDAGAGSESELSSVPSDIGSSPPKKLDKGKSKVPAAPASPKPSKMRKSAAKPAWASTDDEDSDDLSLADDESIEEDVREVVDSSDNSIQHHFDSVSESSTDDDSDGEVGAAGPSSRHKRKRATSINEEDEDEWEDVSDDGGYEGEPATSADSPPKKKARVTGSAAATGSALATAQGFLAANRK